jgi:hypothetical protein
MKRALIAIPIAIVVAILAGVGYVYLADRSTPVGQASLVEMNATAFDAFKADFNRDEGRTRIIALLSPT